MNQSIDESISIFKDALSEIVRFDDEKEKMDFILDVTSIYSRRAKQPKEVNNLLDVQKYREIEDKLISIKTAIPNYPTDINELAWQITQAAGEMGKTVLDYRDNSEITMGDVKDSVIGVIVECLRVIERIEQKELLIENGNITAQ